MAVGDTVHVVIPGVENKNICELNVENVEPELINVCNISWFTLLSRKDL